MSGDASAGHRRISYAQNGEDVRVWRALREVEDVFYVEVGASDPVDDSLTAALSQSGARGVLFEADPAAAQVLRQARPRDVVVAAAASSASGVLTFHQLDRRGWGTVAEQRMAAAGDHLLRTLTVPAVRVDDVLADLTPPEVHFMSIDVEGHEAAVLAGAGLARHRPWILCVEATEPNSRTPSWHGWEPAVLEAGYGFVAFDGLNRWYVAEERAHLTAAVAEPFGVLDRLLDGWVPADVAALEARIRSCDVEVADLQRRLIFVEGLAERAAVQADERLSQAAAVRAELGARVQEAEARTAHLAASRSWRYTRPMRELLYAASSRRPRTLPARSRAVAVSAANRALAHHPRLRAALLQRLSLVPGGLDLVRGWQVPPLPDPSTAVSLHATADARLRTASAALVDHYGSSDDLRAG